MNSSESRPRKTNVNVLLPGTKSAIHRHTETSEVVVCIYGSAIERFYDDEGNETEMVVMTAGSDWPHDDRSDDEQIKISEYRSNMGAKVFEIGEPLYVLLDTIEIKVKSLI